MPLFGRLTNNTSPDQKHFFTHHENAANAVVGRLTNNTSPDQKHLFTHHENALAY